MGRNRGSNKSEQEEKVLRGLDQFQIKPEELLIFIRRFKLLLQDQNSAKYSIFGMKMSGCYNPGIYDYLTCMGALYLANGLGGDLGKKRKD